jgi:hypothetical protein
MFRQAAIKLRVAAPLLGVHMSATCPHCAGIMRGQWGGTLRRSTQGGCTAVFLSCSVLLYACRQELRRGLGRVSGQVHRHILTSVSVALYCLQPAAHALTGPAYYCTAVRMQARTSQRAGWSLRTRQSPSQLQRGSTGSRSAASGAAPTTLTCGA